MRVWDAITNPRIVASCRTDRPERGRLEVRHSLLQDAPETAKTSRGPGRELLAAAPSKAVTVWLAIDDADPENANMRFISGTQCSPPHLQDERHRSEQRDQPNRAGVSSSTSEPGERRVEGQAKRPCTRFVVAGSEGIIHAPACVNVVHEGRREGRQGAARPRAWSCRRPAGRLEQSERTAED